MPELTTTDIDAALEHAVEVVPVNSGGRTFSTRHVVTIGPLRLREMWYADAEALAQRIRDHIRGCLET